MNPKEHEEKLKKTQADLEVELKNLEGVPEMGSDVDHFDEETDETEELGNVLGVRDALKGRLQAVKHALDKIEAGTYGVCEKCGDKIPEEVLQVNPESEHCKDCR